MHCGQAQEIQSTAFSSLRQSPSLLPEAHRRCDHQADYHWESHELSRARCSEAVERRLMCQRMSQPHKAELADQPQLYPTTWWATTPATTSSSNTQLLLSVGKGSCSKLVSVCPATPACPSRCGTVRNRCSISPQPNCKQHRHLDVLTTASEADALTLPCYRATCAAVRRCQDHRGSSSTRGAGCCTQLSRA
jgi:hypothetical protein